MVGGYSVPLLSFRWNDGVCSLQKAHNFMLVWVKTRGHLGNVLPIHLFSPGCFQRLCVFCFCMCDQLQPGGTGKQPKGFTQTQLSTLAHNPH